MVHRFSICVEELIFQCGFSSTRNTFLILHYHHNSYRSSSIGPHPNRQTINYPNTVQSLAHFFCLTWARAQSARFLFWTLFDLNCIRPVPTLFWHQARYTSNNRYIRRSIWIFGYKQNNEMHTEALLGKKANNKTSRKSLNNTLHKALICLPNILNGKTTTSTNKEHSLLLADFIAHKRLLLYLSLMPVKTNKQKSRATS